MKEKSLYAITKLILKSHKNKFSCSLIATYNCRSITLTCLRYKHDVAISVTYPIFEISPSFVIFQCAHKKSLTSLWGILI